MGVQFVERSGMSTPRACIVGLGTSTPPYAITQAQYAEFAIDAMKIPAGRIADRIRDLYVLYAAGPSCLLVFPSVECEVVSRVC